MLKRYDSILTALFYFLDILLSGAALWAADWLRHSLSFGRPIQADTVYLDGSVYLAMALIWASVFRLSSFYISKRTIRLLKELAAVGAATFLSCLTLAAWLFFFDYDDFSRLLLFYFVILDLGVLLNFHLLVRLFLRLIRARGYNLKKMLIIGAGETGTKVAQALVERPWTGFGIAGFLDDAPEKQGQIWAGVAPVLGKLEQARKVVEEKEIDEVVIALPSMAHHSLANVVLDLQDQPVNIRVVPDLFSIATIYPQIEDLWGVPLVGVRQPVLSGFDAALKRMVDLLGAIVGLLIFAPLMLLAAILIKLDSPGPVLFVQKRIGENGRAFKMYKFRTMVANAEELLKELVAVDKLAEPVFKLENDPRVTKLGRILRRTSIDELPQLVNVLRGEMSLVGPRPEEAGMVKHYSTWHRKRLAVKPGITGPMQINGRGDLSLEERVRLELDYIRNYSLWKDLKILLRTVPMVIKGSGSY